MTAVPPAQGAADGAPVRLRGALDALPVYTPGRPATVREGLTAYKISSNENPFPPLPSVLEAVRGAAGGVNRYPDLAVAELTEALAAHLGVPAQRIATGPGSVGVLDQLVRATCDDGDEVVFAWRSFEAYPILTTLAGARPVMVPLAPGARHDLAAMADAVTERTRLVLVCTPNNPTGTTVGAAELEAFLDRVPPEVLVVLDEAYLEFVDAPDAPDAMAQHRARPNVVVLRTFSKAYGLAGLRVGYAVAHEPVARALRACALPFGVNSLAQVAAVASLEAADELAVRVKEIVAERERVVAALREQGWEIPDQQANFVWFDLGEETPDFAQACDAEGLTVRPYGLDGVRATVAEPEANDRLLEVAGRFRRARHG
ncbi:histidinol-phosphate transaminase [Phycicoccus endophyticus]|uniref:Aromatic amino acid aminotransferase n=1 Tax=Phycicoccus endophyticus TaxID=1690220 RepID=A0A7G9R1D7_9MICO|nr:histidinol-phosphate transaminase [Phycicoccus endophyticus]NHI18806.1 histidinol-phosphate transaminase [Phycicoccus endophyticus]QNN49412.1 histidinol-phosphate transaminase [Phycicoccus endophyticus]GGL36413.1 putative phenylalanine aminotransferase [Phycicoccus endophyticus]